MTTRRPPRHQHLPAAPLSVALLGTGAILGSVIAMATPQSLRVADSHGHPIACGTAIRVDHTAAVATDIVNAHLADRYPGFQPTNWAADCDDLAAAKKLHALPVAAIGVALLIAASVTSRRPA